MIVTLSGIDCSGKTTQIEHLHGALEARGHRVRRFWFRPGYGAELDALRGLVRRLRPGALPTTAAPEARARAFASPRVQATWVTMAVADLLLQYALKLRALSLAGHTVLCDRWLDDAALDLELRFPVVAGHLDAGLAGVRAVCPRPHASILLMLPHAEMLRRMALKDEPFPDAPEVRDRRYAAYEALARSGRYTVIDADRPIPTLHAELPRTVVSGT